MISKNLKNAINEQIKWELYSGYLYLSMATWFQEQTLDGFANFFFKQEEEEREHAFKFIEYLKDQGERAIMEQIDKPEAEFKSPEQVFQMSYEHEQVVTKRINDLMDLALKENNHATVSFLQWYVDEQVEEEATMDGILQKLKMIKDNPGPLFQLDAKLGERK